MATPILGRIESTSGEVLRRIDRVLPDLANNSGRATTAGLRFVLLAPAVLFITVAAILLAIDKHLLQKHVEDEIANIRSGVERMEAELGGAE